MATSVAERNKQVLKNRWPGLYEILAQAPVPFSFELLNIENQLYSVRIANHDLASRYNRQREAEIQADVISHCNSEAWIYGVGLGDLPRTLLSRSQLHQLHVVIMNAGIFYQLLDLFDNSDWLADKRVDLVIADESTKLAVPFTVVPPCLQLASDSAARLRDLVLLELNTPFINQRFDRIKPEMQALIAENMNHIETDGDVGALFGTARGDILYVAAAGPTLDDGIEQLREEAGQRTIIAVDAAVNTLLRSDIKPSLVVTIDSHRDNILSYFSSDLDALRTSTLVYFPVVHRDVLDRWPGGLLCAYGDTPLYEEVKQQLPRASLFSFGSVLHVAVDLAVQMGAAEIRLFGTDFGFPNGRYYAGAVNREVKDDERYIADCWVFDGKGGKIKTHPNLRGYLRDLETYISRYSQVRFVSASRNGARIKGTEYL